MSMPHRTDCLRVCPRYRPDKSSRETPEDLNPAQFPVTRRTRSRRYFASRSSMIHWTDLRCWSRHYRSTFSCVIPFELAPAVGPNAPRASG